MRVTGSRFQEFLATRRARVRPEDVGLPRGPRRRVPGLRREEVAALAGVSSDYYIQIERGRSRGVSDEVLAAIAHALRLDQVETAHLFNLAHATRAAAAPRSPLPAEARDGQPPPGLLALVDALATPAHVQNGRLDLLHANAQGRALYEAVSDQDPVRPNFARFVYLDPAARSFYGDWPQVADEAAAMLEAEVGRSQAARADEGGAGDGSAVGSAVGNEPGDDADAPRGAYGSLGELVGELLAGSVEFRCRWGQRDVSDHRRGAKRLLHPRVGELRLRFEALEVGDRPGMRLFGYTADPAHPDTAARLGRLGRPADDLPSRCA